MIETIINDRNSLSTALNTECGKVTVITHSLGAQEALIGLNNAQASGYVDKLINLAPCVVPNLEYFPLPEARRLRNLLTDDEWSDYTKAAKAASKLLSADDYKTFYLALRAK